jgi:hypothetical protein
VFVITTDIVLTPPLLAKKDLRGCRFSTEERLVIAITHYLKNQIGMDCSEIQKVEQAESLSSKDLEKRFTVIPYGSQDEFFQENPECCERTWGLVEGDQFGFWERADGAGDGMFKFKHKVRYTDQDGSRKEIETTNTYIMVYNCGEARDRFYYGNVLDISDLANGH